MRKRLILLCLALCLLSGCASNNLVVRDGLTYRLENGVATLVRFAGGMSEVYIPDEIDGCAVTAIADGTFASAKALTAVSLPAPLTYIGSYAFSKCAALVSVSFRGEALEEIGADAFAACHALETICLPSGLRTLGDSAFADCRALWNVTLPGTLERIGSRAFEQCHALFELQLPPGVTQFGAVVFGGCPAELVLTVFEDSEGLRYAQANGIACEVED